MMAVNFGEENEREKFKNEGERNTYDASAENHKDLVLHEIFEQQVSFSLPRLSHRGYRRRRNTLRWT